MIVALTVASACGTTPVRTAAPVIPTPTTTSDTTSTTLTTTTTTTSAPSAVIPLGLAGNTAGAVEQQLKSLGFVNLQYVDDVGNLVAAADPSWTVMSVDGSGSTRARASQVVVRVAKPAPPPPPQTVEVQPEPVVPDPPAAAYYKNCDAARAAGAAPLHRGDPGYRSALDRDKDGIACE